ncbi:DUF4097 family beta strand repeat-containing protein [Collinsella ihumii]|uniref:DUF4097 family beta strand repeat-containing protein n=1 Tax=Collinsella ihumii TaxID=1720204 RepID=UPI0025AAA737|nr:DUF4097 family beta strand repeat-containing protein [Collinsella ihumii]MDN0055355.1 DUF4097 family beta strand repeat-containing protein [Collinsella ihumii]
MSRLSQGDKVRVGVGIAAIALILMIAASGWSGLFTRWFPVIQIGGFSIGSKPVSLEAPIDRSESFAASEVDDLDIDWKCGSIRLVAGDGDQIRVIERVAAGDYEMDPRNATFTQEGKTLKIDDGLPDSGGTYPHMELVVEVPCDDALMFGNVGIESVSSTIDVERVVSEDLSVASVSSNITLDGIRAQDASIGGVSGPVEVSGEVYEALDVSTMSGGVYLTLTEGAPSEISVSTVSGAIELDVPDGLGFTLAADTVSGGLSTPFELNTVDEDGSYVIGDGACDIDLGSVSGRIHIA